MNFKRLFDQITDQKQTIIWACPSVKTAGQAVRSRFLSPAKKRQPIKELHCHPSRNTWYYENMKLSSRFVRKIFNIFEKHIKENKVAQSQLKLGMYPLLCSEYIQVTDNLTKRNLNGTINCSENSCFYAQSNEVKIEYSKIPQ